MQEREEQLQRFKEGFPEELAASIERRRSDIGDPSQWRVHQIHLTENNKALLLHHRHNPEQHIRLSIHHAPQNLSQDERYSLRVYINQVCADAGIEPYKVQKGRLATDTVSGVRNADPDAWAAFVAQHHPTFVADADRLIRQRGGSTLLDSEDIVGIALAKIFAAYRDNSISGHPQAVIHREIFQQVRTASKHPDPLRKESAELDCDHIIQPAYNGQQEAIAEEWPRLLAEARKLMTGRQRVVLDAIVTNEEQECPLTVRELAVELHMSHQRLYQLFGDIAECIQKAANKEGFEETGAFIDGLVRLNSEGGTAKRPKHER